MQEVRNGPTAVRVLQGIRHQGRAAGRLQGVRQARYKARYAQVRDENIARALEWRRNNPERYRANQQRMRATPEHKLKQRARHLKRKNGITIEQYEAMLQAQDGGCAICGRPPRDDISLHVAHDHGTGAIRGVSASAATTRSLT